MNLPGFFADNSCSQGSRQYGISPPARNGDSSAIRPQKAVGGGTTTTKTCADSYGDCYIGCSVDHPESGDSQNNLNAMLRQGCFDSCDGGFRTCKSASRSLLFGSLAARNITKFSLLR